MSKLVHGIGTNDGKYSTKKDDKRVREYELWKGMLRRCTNKLWSKYPTYTGTTCSENIKSFTFFYEWCQSQVGFWNIDEKGNCWHLDKDLLTKGNKYYSENTCVFIPARINTLLTKCNTKRGELPIGVCWYNITETFMAQCHDGSGNQKNLGYFNTPEEAFQAYKIFKEALIKRVAHEYRTQLDPRAYQALMNYQVEVTD
jgi:hypothetical protein